MKILILNAKEKDDKDPDLLKYFSSSFEAEIDTIELPSKSVIVRFLFCISQTLRILPRINSFDFILSTSTMNGLTLSLIQKLANKLIKPKHIMIDIALLRMADKSSQFHQRLFSFIFSPVEKILCYSNVQKKALIELLGFRDKIEFIPFGIEPSKYSFDDTDNGNYTLCVGRAGRDYKTFLDAVKDIKINVIVVTGKDPVSTNKKIQNKYKNVEVLNEISHEEYKKLMANSLFMVLPLEDTLYPTGQTVLLESMATGKAVIATKTAGTIDYIVDGKTGFFVEPYNVADLKEKIRYLSENPAEARKIGKSSREAVEEKFTMDDTVEGIINVLNEFKK